jgi:type IX secretion system substrate protein
MKNLNLLTAVLLLIISLSVKADWVQTSLNNQTIHAIVTSGPNLVAGTENAIFISSDNGSSWLQRYFNAQIYPVLSLMTSAGYVFAGTNNHGIFWSQDNGYGWFYPHPLTGELIYCLTYNATSLFAGTGTFGVYVSNTGGSSWVQTSLNNKTVFSMIAAGSYLFAGTENEGVYISSNGGTSWIQSSFNNKTVKALAINGNYLFAGVLLNGVYVSSNNGVNWSQTSLNNKDIYSLAVNGNIIYAGSAYTNSFYVSTNNGTNWTLKNEGLNNSVESMCIFNNYIYAGTTASGVYKRPLTELVGIQQISNEVPNSFKLSQNYPNPFNPSTKIKFDIKGKDFVKISVYDISGRLVETLVNENLAAGTYEIEWNAANYSSGVYFYKMISGDPSLSSGQGFTDSKKMLMVK